MDTAQRGMGLPWWLARELIASTAERAAGRRAAGRFADLACGAGTDHLPAGERHSLTAIIDGYAAQLTFVQSTGAQVILMASRALAAAATRAARLPGGLRDAAEAGERAGHPALARRGVRPGTGRLLGRRRLRLRGRDRPGTDRPGTATRWTAIKLSVLDAGHEVALRRRLPAGIRLYTGDDFGYAELIEGDDQGHSDALLGAFAAVTAPAAAALHALDAGDLAGYRAAIGPTVPLSRLIFEEPTYYYKTGVAFLAWLNGHQPRFSMLDGQEWNRPPSHLIKVFELAGGGRGTDRTGPSGHPDDRVAEERRERARERIA